MRKQKTVGGSTKYFIYNGMNIVFEYDGFFSGGTVYYYGLNRTHNSDGEIYVYNAHGDVVQLVKDNAVEVSYTYDAFGNLIEQIGESDNPFLYCGEYYDAETGTYYLRARYYNPANGRFTQQDAWAFMDASDPLSLNLYTYCCNNPVMYVDPSGCFWELVVLGLIVFSTPLLLSSCTTEEYVIEDSERYDKKHPMYDGGTFEKEEAINKALGEIYEAAAARDFKNECGMFVYSVESYNPDSGKMEPRYYSSQIIVGSEGQVKMSPKKAYVPEGAKIVTCIHSHPYHKEANVFADLDVDMIRGFNISDGAYVVDDLNCIYWLDSETLDYSKYKQVK